MGGGRGGVDLRNSDIETGFLQIFTATGLVLAFHALFTIVVWVLLGNLIQGYQVGGRGISIGDWY